MLFLKEVIIKEEKFIINLPKIYYIFPVQTLLIFNLNTQARDDLMLYIFERTIKNHCLILLPLPHSDPPSKQNLPSITPNLLSSFMGHVPSNLGGTPDTIQKV